jgi:hypothetical protein
MARAQKLYPVEIYAFGGLRSHLHLLIGVNNVAELSGFMEYLNGNLAKEAGHIVGWREKFWSRRYRAIEVSDEEAAQMARLRYILSHGPKENLVLRCRDWPGLQCIDALTEGRALEGIWRNRSLEYEARRQGNEGEADPEAFIEPCTLKLDPLPCWQHLPAEETRRRISEMVETIDAESARRVLLSGRVPLGAAAIRKQHSHERPKRSKKSPAPTVHAASRAVRQQLKEAYRLFVLAYREAAGRLRLGDYSVEFPVGCFPPPRPWVPSSIEQPGSRDGPAPAPS